MLRLKGATQSIRSRLLVLVLLTLAPIVGFAGVSLATFAHAERERHLSEAQQTAYRLAGNVERQIDGVVKALRILATSQSLRDDNYEDFHRRALEAKRLLGVEIVLKDVRGQQLVNTRVRSGAPLPVSLPPDDRRAIDTKETEPPRLCRRPQLLRGWGYDKQDDEQILT